MPLSKIQNQQLIPISTAAKVLGVSVNTIRRWEKKGLLQSTRPNGKDRYFSVNDLEEFKAAKTLSTSEAAKHLGVCPTTLRRLDKKGLIKANRDPNGARIFSTESLKEINEQITIPQLKLKHISGEYLSIPQIKPKLTTVEELLDMSRKTAEKPYQNPLTEGALQEFASVSTVIASEAKRHHEAASTPGVQSNTKIATATLWLRNDALKHNKLIISIVSGTFASLLIAFLVIARVSNFNLANNSKPYTLDTKPSTQNVLAATTSNYYLDFNSDLIIQGDLAVGRTINKLALTPLDTGFTIAGGNTSRILTITGGDVTLDQDLSTTSSPTFAGLTIAGATGALVLDSATQTITNKTISGSSNTITNIQSSALSGSYTGITGLGTISTGTWNGTAIGTGYGGTGLTTYTTGDLIYSSASNTLAKLAVGTAGQVLTVSGGVPAWGDSASTVTDLAGGEDSVTGILPVVNGGTGASTASEARTNLGLGTMATQAASSVAITGGTINGTSIGATTTSTGAFTTLAASGATSLTAATVIAPSSGSTTALTLRAAPTGTNSIFDITNNTGSTSYFSIDATGALSGSALKITDVNNAIVGTAIPGGWTLNGNTFTYRRTVTITNSSGSTMPTYYEISLPLSSADSNHVYTNSQQSSPYKDFRIAWDNTGTPTEIARNISSYTSSDITTAFQLQASIANSGTDTYYIYYSNSALATAADTYTGSTTLDNSDTASDWTSGSGDFALSQETTITHEGTGSLKTVASLGTIGAFATTSQGQLPAVLNSPAAVTTSIGGTNYVYVMGGNNGSADVSTVYKASLDTTNGHMSAFATTSQAQLLQNLSGSKAVAATSSSLNGNGADGAVIFSSDTTIDTANTIAGRSCADGGDAVNYTSTANTPAAATSIVLASTPSAGCLVAGDEVLIINLQGTAGVNSDVGEYETKIISSISTSTLNFTTGLTNGYDGTTQKIMVQRVPNYSNVTINNGVTLTASAWNGTKGGVLMFRASGTVTVTGSISTTGKGFRGGDAGPYECSETRNYGYQGETYSGIGAQSTARNNGGGGGGDQSTDTCANMAGGAGGGGFGAAGSDGVGNRGSTPSPAQGGNAYGAANLATLFLGSGGGGGSSNGDYGLVGGNGGAGGGIIFINANTLTVTGSIANNGAAGSGNNPAGGAGGGGGGAGGSIFLDATTATLGSDLTTSTAGAGQTGGHGDGGNGGVGRVAIKTTTVTGTTNPTYTAATSTSLVDISSNNLYLLGGINGSTRQSTVYKSAISGSDLGAFATTSQAQLPVALSYPTSQTVTISTANYVYVIGGNSASGDVSTVYKSTVSSGNLGAFATTSQGQLPQALSKHSSSTVSIGGTNYIYIVGGINGSTVQSTVYKTTVDGSGDLSTFATTSQGQLPVALYSATSSIATIGGTSYIYVLGGINSGGSKVSTVYKAQIGATGNIGSFSTTGQNQLSASLSSLSSVTATVGTSQYIYALGGAGASASVSTVYKAKVNDMTNFTATKTISSTDLSNKNDLTFWVYSATTGSYMHLDISEDGSTWSNCSNFTISSASTWEQKSCDISGIAAASRNGITKLRISTDSTANITSSFTTYFDDIQGVPNFTSLNNTTSYARAILGAANLAVNAQGTGLVQINYSASPASQAGSGGFAVYDGTTNAIFTVESTGTVDLVTGATYQINNTNVLSATALGTGVLSSSLTSVGTITSGTWNGTDVAVAAGGTGASDAETARTNLGLAIGTNVQAYDADLTTFAGITPSANIQSLLGSADYSTARTNLGLGTISTQAADSVSISGGTLTGITSLTTTGDIQTSANLGFDGSKAIYALNNNPLSIYASSGTLLDSSSANTSTFATTSQGQIPQAMYGHSSSTATIGGTTYVYIIGGNTGTNQSTVYKATLNTTGDVQAFATTNQAQLPQIISTQSSLVQTIGGTTYLYVLGGSNGDDVSTVYKATLNTTGDVQAFATTNQAQLPINLRINTAHTQTIGGTSYVYMIGGCNGAGCATIYSTVYRATIDPTTADIGAFGTTSQGQLPQAIRSHASITQTIGGTTYLYVLGGCNGASCGTYQSTVYKATIDPSTGNVSAFSTTSQGQLPVTVQKLAAVTGTSNGTNYVYVIGGDTGSTVSTVYKAQINATGDIQAFATTNQAQLPQRTNFHTAFAQTVGGTSYVYVVGGWTSSASSAIYKSTLSQTTQALTIASSGSIGMGTTDPGAYKLNVLGDANISGSLTVSGELIGPSSGTNGYWSRTDDVLSPVNAGDGLSSVGNIVSQANDSYDLGTSENRWAYAYLQNLDVAGNITTGAETTLSIDDITTSGDLTFTTVNSSIKALTSATTNKLGSDRFNYSKPITVNNTSASTMPRNHTYTLILTGDDAADVYNNSQADADDVRITYNNGEIQRVVDKFTSSEIYIRFAIEVDILTTASDANYDIFYGNSTLSAPTAYSASTVLDASDTASDWTSSAGTIAMSDDTSNFIETTGSTKGSAISSNAGAFSTSSQGQLPIAYYLSTATTATVGGTTYVYSIGGTGASNYSTVHKATIDPSNANLSTFATTSQAQLPQTIFGASSASVEVGGTSYIYVIGGNGTLSTVYRAQINTTNGNVGAFATTNQGQLPQAQLNQSIVVSTIGGTNYIYVIGGAGTSGSVVYKAAIDSSGNAGTFATTSQAQLPVALSRLSSVTVTIGGTGYIYVIGGRTPETSTVYKATIDSSGNVGTFATTSQAQLPQTIMYHSSMTASSGGTNYIYVIGGAHGTTGLSTVYKAQIDPATGNVGTFATTNQGQIPQVTSGHAVVAASISNNTYIYTLGGIETNTTNYYSTAYKTQIGGGAAGNGATITKTINSTNLTDKNMISYWLRASATATATNLVLEFSDDDGSTWQTSGAPSLTSADTWELQTWDISGIANGSKDTVTKLRFRLTGDITGTFQFDEIRAEGVLFAGTSTSSAGETVSFANNIYLNSEGLGTVGINYNSGSTGGFTIYDGATTARMSVLSNGNVGIGTTNPSVLFEVKGAGTGANIAKFTDVNDSGCTLATGGTISCSSDQRLKKNISDIGYGLDELLKLNPVEFNWRSEDDSITKSLGFIAQEVEGIIPKLVITDATTGLKELNTIGLIPVLTKSIQELDLKYKNLEDKLASISGQLQSTNSADLTSVITQPGINELRLTPPEQLLATTSAQLVDLSVTSEATFSGNLAAYSATISDTFKSLGNTFLGNTTVAGDFNIDGTLTITGDSLNSLSTLYLQNNSLAGSVDMFNGKVVIDNQGNIKVGGNLELEGAVTISAIAGENLTAGNAVSISADETVIIADSTSTGKTDVVGLVVANASINQPVKVAIGGKISGLTNLIAGKKYYLGKHGQLVTTPPLNSVKNIQVGIGFNPNQLLIQIFDFNGLIN